MHAEYFETFNNVLSDGRYSYSLSGAYIIIIIIKYCAKPLKSVSAQHKLQ